MTSSRRSCSQSSDEEFDKISICSAQSTESKWENASELGEEVTEIASLKEQLKAKDQLLEENTLTLTQVERRLELMQEEKRHSKMIGLEYMQMVSDVERRYIALVEQQQMRITGAAERNTILYKMLKKAKEKTANVTEDYKKQISKLELSQERIRILAVQRQTQFKNQLDTSGATHQKVVNSLYTRVHDERSHKTTYQLQVHNHQIRIEELVRELNVMQPKVQSLEGQLGEERAKVHKQVSNFQEQLTQSSDRFRHYIEWERTKSGEKIFELQQELDTARALCGKAAESTARHETERKTTKGKANNALDMVTRMGYDIKNLVEENRILIGSANQWKVIFERFKTDVKERDSEISGLKEVCQRQASELQASKKRDGFVYASAEPQTFDCSRFKDIVRGKIVKNRKSAEEAKKTAQEAVMLQMEYRQQAQASRRENQESQDALKRAQNEINELKATAKYLDPWKNKEIAKECINAAQNLAEEAREDFCRAKSEVALLTGEISMSEQQRDASCSCSHDSLHANTKSRNRDALVSAEECLGIHLRWRLESILNTKGLLTNQERTVQTNKDSSKKGDDEEVAKRVSPTFVLLQLASHTDAQEGTEWVQDDGFSKDGDVSGVQSRTNLQKEDRF